MNQYSQEEQKYDHYDCGLEENCSPLSPAKVEENLVKDILELFESKVSCGQVVLLRNRKLILIVINVFIVTRVVVNKLSNLLSNIIFLVFGSVFLLFRAQFVRASAKTTLRMRIVFLCASSLHPRESLDWPFWWHVQSWMCYVVKLFFWPGPHHLLLFLSSISNHGLIKQSVSFWFNL